jgi:hypothetical protein
VAFGMTVRLGVIGVSPGNGHPYSWSAICNGYSPEAMRDCGFPVIPEYLARQDWPAARLPGVSVTHVWTEDPQQSRHIARAALIDHVVDRREDMIGVIDGLLLARDDAQNHLTFAEPFLRAGLPVYVDKPVALSLADFHALHTLEQYEGQIFSCSALRFSDDLRLSGMERSSIGDIRFISGTVPKQWDTYAVHLIDPLLTHLITGQGAAPRLLNSVPYPKGRRSVLLDFPKGPLVNLVALGQSKGPISFRLYGDVSWCEKEFKEAFSAFRAALTAFVRAISAPPQPGGTLFNRRVVEIIEMGREHG